LGQGDPPQNAGADAFGRVVRIEAVETNIGGRPFLGYSLMRLCVRDGDGAPGRVNGSPLNGIQTRWPQKTTVDSSGRREGVAARNHQHSAEEIQECIVKTFCSGLHLQQRHISDVTNPPDNWGIKRGDGKYVKTTLSTLASKG
jgi:hypothetical protein